MRLSGEMENVFRAKQQWHQALVRLPFARKMRLLLSLQEMAYALCTMAGRNGRRPWHSGSRGSFTKMDKALDVINRLERSGVMKRYAIGGQAAVYFHTESMLLTYDLDVFVMPLAGHGSPALTVSPLYDHLKRKGYRARHQHVLIQGVPTQFIPAYNALVEEAVTRAMARTCGNVRTRILRAEHLLAIMLQMGRPRASIPMRLLLKEGAINRDDMADLVNRYALRREWQALLKRAQ